MHQANAYEHTNNDILQFVVSHLWEMTKALDVAHFTFPLWQLRLILKLSLGQPIRHRRNSFAMQLHNISLVAYKMIHRYGQMFARSLQDSNFQTLFSQLKMR